MAKATHQDVSARNVPPTDAEIRELLESELRLTEAGRAPFDEPDGVWEALRVVLDSDAAMVPSRRFPDGWEDDFSPDEDHPGTLWADMTPDEYRELDELVGIARQDAMRVYLRTLREGVIFAVSAFAEEHPDIPRGRWPIERPEGRGRGSSVRTKASPADVVGIEEGAMAIAEREARARAVA